MANTAYLKQVVEPYIREWVAAQIGVPLHKKKVVVGQTTEGIAVRFEFDGVSEDGTIGVCISASSSYKTGQMRKYFYEATLLNRVPQFTRRIMVFTYPHIWPNFKNQCDGLVDLGRVEYMICPLPPEMQTAVSQIYKQSAEEVGDKSGPGLRNHGARG